MAPVKPFQLIVISPPFFIPGESTMLTRLFREGLQHYHLRKQKTTKQKLIRFLHQIPEEYYSRIVLHSHYSLLDQFRLGGFHLSEKRRKALSYEPLPQRWIPYLVSTSYHSIQEMKDGSIGYTYVFISPIFDSISKPGYRAGMKPEEWKKNLIRLKKENKQRPATIALGGIQSANIRMVREMGFDGAAVLGALWEADDPVDAYRKLRSTFDSTN